MNARTRALAITLVTLLAACASRRGTPSAPPPSSWREWDAASSTAARLVAENKTATADSALADFARRWPGTPEAEQADWLRLGYLAERADDSTTTALLVMRIDSMLVGVPSGGRRGELVMLRRAAVLTQQLRAERAQARLAVDAATKQRSDEVDRLKAELENVKAELDRVRNRVTRRRP